MNKEILIVAGIIVLLMFTVLLILLIISWGRTAKLNRTVTRMKRDINRLRGNSLDVDEMSKTEFENTLRNLDNRMDAIERKQLKCIDRVDIVRYFADDKAEGRSSYSVALTNEKKDGLVLTALMYRNGMNLYVKKVEEGISDYPLSDEEKEAVSRSKVTQVLG